jgi:hypothetical protein
LLCRRIEEVDCFVAETKPHHQKWIWIVVGAMVTYLICHHMADDVSWEFYLYVAIGSVITALWFLGDKAPSKDARWDIAAAFPILVMLWPILIFAVVFPGHFRDPPRKT